MQNVKKNKIDLDTVPSNIRPIIESILLRIETLEVKDDPKSKEPSKLKVKNK